MKKSAPKKVKSPPALKAASNKKASDWRSAMLARIRKIIKQADPDVVEEVKWRKPSNAMAGVPVWSHDGIICTGETYKSVVKTTFAKGASLADPNGLFNSSLEGATRRAIDFHEGDKIDEQAFQALVRAAVALNTTSAAQRPGTRARVGVRTTAGATSQKSAKVVKNSAAKRGAAKPTLLSGGNPQIAKADGDAPVQAYIAAMPGWKRDVGRRLDALIVHNAPNVRKAVRWNTPFYGVEGQGWFVGFHCLAKYVKVAFFRGASLRPVPPVASKNEDTRYLHIHEDDELDEAQFARWVKQASRLPGWGVAEQR